MRYLLALYFFCLALTSGIAQANEPAAPCCGVVSAAGLELNKRLDETRVDVLWPAHLHVNWETGEPDREGFQGKDSSSHCSAFVGATLMRWGIYILRPPEHPQQLLANAQTWWLGTKAAEQAGWREVTTVEQAQVYANQGKVVVVSFPNPDRTKPGHIAIVRAAEKSAAQLASNGPDVTQAGAQNYLKVSANIAFRHHFGAWPDGVKYFVYAP
jgi:hypothetical protein